MKSGSLLLAILGGFWLATACTPDSSDSVVPGGVAAVEQGFIPVEGGLRLHYRLFGEGDQTLVFLHGGPGFNFMGSGPDLLPLADGYRLLMYDQRGGGRSDSDPDAGSQAPVVHVEDLEAVRRHFGMDRMTLLGHSWGSLLAAFYATRYPDHVERLVLMGPMESSRALLEKRLAVEEKIAEQASAQLAALAGQEELPADSLARCRAEIATLQAFYYHDPAKMKTRQGDYCDAPVDGLARMQVISEAIVGAMGNYDLAATLQLLQMPALVLEGARSPLPLDGARAWARALPNSRLWLIEGVGHAYPFVEAPEVFFAGVQKFLAGDWPAGSKSVE